MVEVVDIEAAVVDIVEGKVVETAFEELDIETQVVEVVVLVDIEELVQVLVDTVVVVADKAVEQAAAVELVAKQEFDT